MSDNDWKSRLGTVYSTDPDFRYRTKEEPEPETACLRRARTCVYG